MIGATALFAAVSCESELDIPQKARTPYGEFFASDADAQAALTNMYVNYINNVAATEGIDVPEQVMLNYAADDILSAGGHNNDHDAFRVFDEFDYDDANGTLQQAYQRYFYAIFHANLVICNFTNENKNATEPKFTSDFTKQCVAEARVMRAYLHLMTALTWNCPPLMDRLYEEGEFPTNAASQKDVLNWVIAECEKAISSGSLPVRKDTGDKDATARMSVGFAQFIAGKAAMFNGDAATARKYLGDLINSGKYALIDGDDYWTNFHVSGDGNSEKIFEPNFIDDPNFTSDAWGTGQPILRGRWMVANVLNWRRDILASEFQHTLGVDGWNGGAIEPTFAAKFLAHDGDSPRRLACFITGDEWLYELDWSGSEVNNGTLEDKMKDPNRGIKAASGMYSHGPYLEWKHQVYINPPKILTGGKSYQADNVSGLGPGSNQTNYKVARYAEALLLYAEACIGSADEAKGLAALNEVQKRAFTKNGTLMDNAKISSKLTFADVMEEKQYEMWFESCRFHDLVRWSNEGKIAIKEVYNDDIHKNVPILYDAFFTKGEATHRLYTEPAGDITFNSFEEKYKYLPFPRSFKDANPNLKDVLGWAK